MYDAAVEKQSMSPQYCNYNQFFFGSVQQASCTFGALSPMYQGADQIFIINRSGACSGSFLLDVNELKYPNIQLVLSVCLQNIAFPLWSNRLDLSHICQL